MDQTKELRIDLFLYFVVVFGHLFTFASIIGFTTFFALRLWFPDLLAEFEREIAEEIHIEEPVAHEVEVNDFTFSGTNDLSEQDCDKLD